MSEERNVRVAELARMLDGRVVGDGAREVRDVAPLDRAAADQVSFCSGPGYLEAARATAAGCVICGEELDLALPSQIVVGNPKRAWAEAIAHFRPAEEPAPGVAESAVVEDSAALGERVYVGPLAYVGARCRIGSDARIHAGAVVREDCVVGEGCTIHGGVVLYPRTELGDRVVIHGGAVVGADGFGFALSTDAPFKVPQVGRVVIEDEVEIGACTCIDRATLTETRIGARTKIDNLVQIGHNTVIGPDTIIVAQVGISGSAEVGRGAILAGQVGLKSHVRVGAGARVLGKSAVFGDVGDGETVAGVPAIDHREWKRMVTAARRLPQLVQRVRSLEALLRERERKGESG